MNKNDANIKRRYTFRACSKCIMTRELWVCVYVCGICHTNTYIHARRACVTRQLRHNHAREHEGNDIDLFLINFETHWSENKLIKHFFHHHHHLRLHPPTTMYSIFSSTCCGVFTLLTASATSSNDDERFVYHQIPSLMVCPMYVKQYIHAFDEQLFVLLKPSLQHGKLFIEHKKTYDNIFMHLSRCTLQPRKWDFNFLQTETISFQSIPKCY